MNDTWKDFRLERTAKHGFDLAGFKPVDIKSIKSIRYSYEVKDW